jgi:hypothetical protein
VFSPSNLFAWGRDEPSDNLSEALVHTRVSKDYNERLSSVDPGTHVPNRVITQAKYKSCCQGHIGPPVLPTPDSMSSINEELYNLGYTVNDRSVRTNLPGNFTFLYHAETRLEALIAYDPPTSLQGQNVLETWLSRLRSNARGYTPTAENVERGVWVDVT